MDNSTTPINQLPAYTDESIMQIGKFRGRRLDNVPAEHLLYMYDEYGKKINDKRLYDYIEDNLQVLRKQAKEREDRND